MGSVTHTQTLLLKSRQPSRRESVFVSSSAEQRLAGQRRGAEEGAMGRNRYCEEGGPGKDLSMEWMGSTGGMWINRARTQGFQAKEKA